MKNDPNDRRNSTIRKMNTKKLLNMRLGLKMLFVVSDEEEIMNTEQTASKSFFLFIKI